MHFLQCCALATLAFGLLMRRTPWLARAPACGRLTGHCLPSLPDCGAAPTRAPCADAEVRRHFGAFGPIAEVKLYRKVTGLYWFYWLIRWTRKAAAHVTVPRSWMHSAANPARTKPVAPAPSAEPAGLVRLCALQVACGRCARDCGDERTGGWLPALAPASAALAADAWAWVLGAAGVHLAGGAEYRRIAAAACPAPVPQSSSLRAWAAR